MKILFVSDQYYPLGGGIEQYLRGLARQLTVWGHQVTHLTRSVEGCPQEEAWPEGRVIRTPLLLDAVPHPEITLSRWRQLIPIIKSVKPDVVYANNHTSLATIKASKYLGIPVVYCCHGWGLLCPLKIRFLKPDNSLCYNKRSIKNCLNCYKMMTKPAAITGLRSAIAGLRWGFSARKYVAKRVAQYNLFQGILDGADARIVFTKRWAEFFTPAKTYAIPLGIDIDNFHSISAESFRKVYCIEGPYVLVAGRIHNTKGQDLAIRSMAYLPKWFKLVLAGTTSLFAGPKHQDNAYIQYLKQLVRDFCLQDRVVFTGFLTSEELVSAYSGAEATLVPSVWLDPYPTVTLEAISCACPVVVTDNCGTAELITDGNEGYTVTRMAPEGMAKATLEILPRRGQMGRLARKKAERELNWQKTAKRVLEVFETVI